MNSQDENSPLYKRKPFNPAKGKEADERNLDLERAGNAANDPRPGAEYDDPGQKQMEQAVCELLTSRQDLDASNIDVHVQEGEVWLTGSVDSDRSKRLAGDLLKTVYGMTSVHNELVVASGGHGAIGAAEGGYTVHPGETQSALRAMRDGMPVVGDDGKHVGTIKQIFDNSVQVSRRLQHDLYIPARAFAAVVNGEARLSIPAREVDHWGWDKPVVISPPPPAKI